MADSNGEFFLKSSELFESPVYLEEVADVLCILQAGQWRNIFGVKTVKNFAWQVSEKNTIKLFYDTIIVKEVNISFSMSEMKNLLRLYFSCACNLSLSDVLSFIYCLWR